MICRSLRPWRDGLLGLALGLSVALTAPLHAQISPGDLAEVHVDLEGSGNCLTCHRARRGIDPAACLSCHATLRLRLSKGRGLHARAEYADCKTCHIDHQGRQFELIWWGDDGVSAFDHSDTGYSLVGSHRGLGCRDCHREKHLQSPERLHEAGKRLERTYLGLDAACDACHDDPHRGQFASGGGCDQCHGLDAFSPAVSFDHDESEFPLVGRHRTVTCAGCHPPLPGSSPARSGSVASADGESPRLFRGLDSSCRSCHQDPHGGRLGSNCATCHDSRGWSVVETDGFQHGVTQFALRGRHGAVTCAQCHGEGMARPRPAFERCQSCHQDIHLGQFVGLTHGEDCGDCHDENGFSPSHYTRDDHSALYPLEGRHQETPCRGCHTETTLEKLGAMVAVPEVTSDSPRVIRFRFPSRECAVCHEEGHGGETVPATDACGRCHDTSSWWSVAFSHRETGYALEGGHRGVECRACHHGFEGQPDEAAELLHFAGLSRECGSCHRDAHAGQFAGADATTDCARCHQGARWSPVDFDHETDSRFSLRGAHARVDCGECHPSELRGERTVVSYRPLARACAGCHAAIPLGEDPK